MLFSLRSFLQKISPDDIDDNSFSYRTSKYKLNYYESPSGLKLVMNTDLNSTPKELLKTIYSQVSSASRILQFLIVYLFKR